MRAKAGKEIAGVSDNIRYCAVAVRHQSWCRVRRRIVRTPNCRTEVDHFAGARPLECEAALLDDTGRRFWAFVTTVPLNLLTVANLFVAWRAAGALRGWWLAAGLAALADRVFTFSYFIPTMVGLMGRASSAESVAVATRWRNLNYLRHLIVLTAWLASLRAFALFYQQRG